MGPASCTGHRQSAERGFHGNQYHPPTAEKYQMTVRHRMAGFTLVEALVATVLMGLILAALATITARWLPNWNHGIARLQRNEQVALGLERVAADLAAAEYIAINHETRKPFFDGTNRSVIFVRTSLGPNSGPGLEVVRIAESTSEQGVVLVRTRAAFKPGIDPTQLNFTDPVVLLRAPYQVFFSYAATDRNWRDDWRQQPQLPSAVKLSLRDTITQRVVSLSTATLIHVEVPADCIAAKSYAECLDSQVRPAAAGGKSPT
jgi:general secretion pathway protein J